MKHIALLFTAIALATCTTACSQISVTTTSKNYATKEIRTDNFTALEVTGSYSVYYTQQPGKPSVKVVAADNIIDRLDIRVKGKCLCIGFKKNTHISYNGKLEVYASSGTLDDISLTGSGAIELTNGLKTEDLQVTLTGSGDIKGKGIRCTGLSAQVTGSGDLELKDVKASLTQAQVTGSGDLKLSGETGEAQYTVTGSGDLWAEKLQAQKATAHVSGSGDIRCHADVSLKASVSGSGSIGYKGAPKLEASAKGVHKL